MIFITLMTAALNLTQPPVEDVIYTIPAAEGMEEALTFTVEDAFLHEADGVAQMGFRLPALLNGRNGQQFFLSGPVQQDRLELQGVGAAADCSVDRAKTECTIFFDKLKLDHKAAEKVLLEQHKGQQLDLIKHGREVFEHQAIGVITFFH